MLNDAAFGWGLGLWYEYARACMLWLSVGALVFFGLPMMLWPLRWAKLLGWTIPGSTGAPEDAHLAIYFGRTLGMVTCALATVGLCVLDHPTLWPLFFNLNILIFLANTAVHAWGAIRRIQPLSETLEIPYWFALAVLLYLFYPVAQWRWV